MNNDTITNLENSDRNYGIDLLRVIAMIMVVCLHVLLYGMDINAIPSGTVNYYIAWALESICYAAVNIYGLISGFCLYNRKNSLRRLFNLWLQIFFYSILSTVTLAVFAHQSFSIKMIFSSCFPILSGIYWYATAYFVMYLFIPFFNKLLSILDFRQTKTLVFMLLFVFGFLSWIAGVLGGTGAFGVYNGYTVIWLCVLFFVGAAIKKYGISVVMITHGKLNKKIFPVLGLISGISVFLSKVLISLVTTAAFGRSVYDGLFYSYCSPFVIAEALCLFAYFTTLKMKKEKAIKLCLRLSTATFGVYIIHLTKAFDCFVWGLFKPYSNHILFFPIVILGTIILYFLCSAFELLRIKIFKIIKSDKFSDFIVGNIEKVIKKFDIMEEI